MASRKIKVDMGRVENTVLRLLANAIGRGIDSEALIKGLLDVIHPVAFTVCKTMGQLGMQGNSRVLLAYRGKGRPLHVSVRPPQGVALPNVDGAWFEVSMLDDSVSGEMERMRRVAREVLGGIGELPTLGVSFLDVCTYVARSGHDTDVMFGMFPELVGLFPRHDLGRTSTIAMPTNMREEVYNTRKLLHLLTVFKATVDDTVASCVDVHVSFTTTVMDFDKARDAFARLPHYA